VGGIAQRPPAVRAAVGLRLASLAGAQLNFGELVMTSEPARPLVTLTGYRVLRIVAVILAVCPTMGRTSGPGRLPAQRGMSFGNGRAIDAAN
jgi:hypothetical protein